jgi:hypothetical protein
VQLEPEELVALKVQQLLAVRAEIFLSEDLLVAIIQRALFSIRGHRATL